MIDFKNTWLPQIIRYAKLIADDEILRNAWISADQTRTSVTTYDELIEQVFDDLDSERVWDQHKEELEGDPSLQAAIDRFLNSILTVDAQYARTSPNPTELLSSPLWQEVRRAAAQVTKAGAPKDIVIDGGAFSTADGFYLEIIRKFTEDLDWVSYDTEKPLNLNSVNDFLRGGFGVFEYEEPITVRWIHSEKSKNDLNKPGDLLFDTIVGYIKEQKHIELILE